MALVAGCGDNLSADDDLTAPDNWATDTAAPEMAERLTPKICSAQAFESVTYDAKDSILRAVPASNGASVFMVPRSGGVLRGFQIDGRGLVIGNPQGQKIRSNVAFTDVSASRVDGRLIVGVVAGIQTSVMAIRDDLQDFRELALVDGTLMGDTAGMHVHNTRVTTTGGASGMQMTTFDANWAAMGTEVVARSVPTSMTSAAYGNDAMISWSTPTECHVQRIGAGIESMRPFPCTNGRLAVDYAQRGGWLVYERDGGIMIAGIVVDGQNQIASAKPLVRFGTSPRIAYDGAHYWISYIDLRGDVVMGLLDSSGSALDGVAIEGTQPLAGAYDIAMSGSNPWVFALDGNGLGATKLCISRL
jgi:hypothetical protein